MATANNPEDNFATGPTDDASDQTISNPVNDEEWLDYMTLQQRGEYLQEGHAVYNISAGPTRLGTVDSDTLELMLDQANETFVPTRIFKHIRRSLEKDCHVTICGASGEGKTTMALMLGQKYIAEGYELVFVNRIDVFDIGACISSGQKICIIFDDFLGSVAQSSDNTYIETLCNALKIHIDHCLRARQRENSNAEEKKGGINKVGPEKTKQSKTKALRVVFTAKTYNFKEGVSRMQYLLLSLFNMKTMVDLTLEISYSQKEKIAMFEKHREKNQKKRNGDFDIKDVVYQEETLFGFPLTCRLFFEFSSLTEKGVDFFKRPLFYLRIELNDILSRRNDQAAALILVMLCEGNIKLPELESPNINTKVDEIFLNVANFANSATRSGTASAARSFRGTFLSRGDNLCFAHSSIYEACACALYKFNPTFVLKFCSLDFLYERVKPRIVDETRVSQNLHFLFVSEEYFHLVVTRLITSMKLGIFSKTVAHPLNQNDNFVKMLLEELETSASEDKDWIREKEKGRCFLYWIAQSKSKRLVECIEQVLVVDFTQDEIKEAVLAAVECDSMAIFEHLIERLEQNLDETALNALLLASAKSSSEEMVQHLLNMGAQVLGTDTNNRNVLHLICIHDRPILIKIINSLSCVTINGLQIAKTALDKDKRTPLMLAALYGTWNCFKEMQYEEIKDVSDCYGDHLINLACLGGNKSIVERILTMEKINTRGHAGMTPIMNAAMTARSEVFDILFRSNADITLVDDDRITLLHYAFIGGSEHIVGRLVTPENINTRYQGGKTAIMVAADTRQSEIFDLCLSKNADNELVDDDENTLLHHACIGGSKDIVKRLVTHVNINIRGHRGMTPIMTAANKSRSKLFDFLLSKKADIAIVDHNGNTLLHHACAGGSKHIVERLVTPENINSRGQIGLIPIMVAVIHAHSDIFDLLLIKNAEKGLVDDDGNTLLHHACVGGSKHIVECLVTPENINTESQAGMTSIMRAADNAHSEIFDFLLSMNADIKLLDGDGNALLHHGCLGGSKHIVERLVTNENINRRGVLGITPIMTAAIKGEPEVFEFLLSKKADSTLVGDDGNTLLHHACLGGSKHIVERLVTPENINTRGHNGMTAIMLAVNRGHSEIFDYLLIKDADIDLVDDYENTLLHHACLGGSKPIAERLVSPENINTRGHVGITPIITAVNHAHLEIVDLFLSKNADSALVDDNGDTVLHHACVKGNKYIVDRLVTPENINTRGQGGVTPIMAAANYARSSIFDIFLSKGAKQTTVDDNGNTLLHHACYGGNKNIVERLVTPENINTRCYRGMTPIMAAANSGRSKVFDFLLSKNADSALDDDNGNTVLHHACIKDSKHIVKRLLTPENINTRGHSGMTPIMTAANKSHSDIFDMILSKNADIAIVDDNGDTLLHHACIGGSKHIVERLVTPENINIRGQAGTTPIMVAACRAQSVVFDFLLSKNADTTLVDNRGNSLLYHACLGGSKDIVERL